MIQNPILPGFNPDPSMIRVGQDFYLITSSFEWFPGIPLYHSRDLVHWKHIDNLLKTKQQVDLTGLRASRGVWAPNLSYCEGRGRFYLTYSNVHSQNRWLFDVDNYMMWAEDIHGPWSEPVYINSSGFDPSLFHDEDGTTWVLNKDRDFRPWNIDKRSIVLQRFDLDTASLVGEPVVISRGATRRRFVEGAHLLKKDGLYYLLTAEGGTGYGHCVAAARSKSVTGPYLPCPSNPVLTSCGGDFTASEEQSFMMPERYNPEAELQKAGHGNLVDTPDGSWYMVHLCGRPLMPQKRCILGRETALQKFEWTADGWPRLAGGGNIAKAQTPAPDLPPHPVEPHPVRCEFDKDRLELFFCTPRNEITPDWADLTDQPGFLRLRGRESLTSSYDLSLVARRLTDFCATVTVKMQFAPEHYHHLAGLCCYYDSDSHYCVYKTWDDEHQHPALAVYAFTGGAMTFMGGMVAVPGDAPVYLRASLDGARLRFSYSLDRRQGFQTIGPGLDASLLSDEASQCGWFTGTFVGMFAQDTHTKSKWAAFDWFEYQANAPDGQGGKPE